MSDQVEAIDENKDVLLGKKILSALNTEQPLRPDTTPVQADAPSILQLRPGSLYELSGPPDAGKSLVIQDVALACLLRGHTAIIVDCDYRINVLGLLQKLKDLCRARSLTSKSFKAMCRNLTIQKCGSSTELQLFVAFGLPQLLASSQVALVAIDSLGTFYWHDRYARPSVGDSYSVIWMRLAELGRHYALTIVVSVQHLLRERAAANVRRSLRPPTASLDVTAVAVQNLGRGRFAIEFADRVDVFEMQAGQLKSISSCCRTSHATRDREDDAPNS